jgi:4-hydroxybutyrate CoA-transferase
MKAPSNHSNWQAEYQSKIMTAQEAAARIKSNDRVALSGGTCIPPGFCNALSERAGEVENVTLALGYALGLYGFMAPENKESFTIETMFVGPVERMCMEFGVSSYVPMHLGDVAKFTESGNFNVVTSVATPPDENGYMTRSLFGSFLSKETIRKADTVIIEVNKQFPRMNSDDFKIHVSEVDCIIENDAPVFEVPEIVITEEEEKIAGYIADMIPDGSTIQLGFGGLGNAIGHLLKDKKDLGMHAEVVTPSVMELMKAGVLNGSRKNYKPGKVVAAFCVGTKPFYDFIDGNMDLEFLEIGKVNNPMEIAKNDNLISINNALMFDLTGQAASESIGTRQYSGTGGQVNFVHGSKLSNGGKSILALNATYKDKEGKLRSKILPVFPEGTVVTTSRNDVEYVVTEYGVANLKFKNITDRAKALIAIAHPDFRDELAEGAKKHGWL